MEKISISIRDLQRTRIKISRKWLRYKVENALKLLNLINVDLSIVFVNDDKIKKLNNSYRGVNKTTDVLSFPIYSSPKEFPHTGEIFLGDIVINLPEIIYKGKGENSKRVSKDKDRSIRNTEELIRPLIHGLLHLIGFDHEKNAYQARKMKRKEMEILYALERMDTKHK